MVSMPQLVIQYSRLRDALRDASTGPKTVTSDLFKGIGSLQIIIGEADPNLPQPLYWSINEGDPVPTIIQFPALLDMNAPHTQVGPYFNNPTNKPITSEEFTKMKATFAVLPLPDNAVLYSREAIECSKRTIEFLERLAQDTEVERNTYLRVSKRNLTFWNNVDRYNHTIALKLQTEALCTAPGDKHHGATTANTMPDPILRYRNLFKSEPELAGYEVISPSIKGHNGSIIAPGDYLDKLRDEHLTPVCVEVIPRIWEIQPAKHSKKPAKRVYQLLIKSIQLLPIKKVPPPTSHLPPSSTPQTMLKRKHYGSNEMEVSPRNKHKI